MNKSVIGAILAVVVVLILGGVFVTANNNNDDKANKTSKQPTSNSQNTPTPSMNEVATVDKVAIQDFAFSPAKIRVKKGTTVTWTNKDSAKHDVTPDNPSADFKAPDKLMAKDESYSITFNQVGTFTYFCSPHPYMKGSVEVTE